MNSITQKFILRTDRGNGVSFPLAMQAFINGDRCIIGMGITLQKVNWSDERQVVVYSKESNLTKKEIAELNEILIHRRDLVGEIRHHYTLSGQHITGAIFKEEFNNQSRKNSVAEFMEKEIAHLKEVHAAGTYRHHLVTLGRIKEFMPNMVFADLDTKLIEKWGVWLRKKGIQESTIWKYHKELKMFINLAKERKIRVENPYDKIRLERIKGNREWLQPSEVEKLKDLYQSATLPEHLQRVLGCFIFCCYTGLRISDVSIITHEEIMHNELVFMMQKNKKKQKIVRVPLNETAASYIQSKSGRLFNIPADTVVNRHLKEIWYVAKLSNELSFHSSRHTFAMLFLDAGGKVEVLQRIMGHSKIETTMEYVHLRNEAAREQMGLMDKKKS